MSSQWPVSTQIITSKTDREKDSSSASMVNTTWTESKKKNMTSRDTEAPMGRNSAWVESMKVQWSRSANTSSSHVLIISPFLTLTTPGTPDPCWGAVSPDGLPWLPTRDRPLDPLPGQPAATAQDVYAAAPTAVNTLVYRLVVVGGRRVALRLRHPDSSTERPSGGSAPPASRVSPATGRPGPGGERRLCCGGSFDVPRSSSFSWATTWRRSDNQTGGGGGGAGRKSVALLLLRLLLLLLLLEDEGGVEAPLCFLWRVAGARIALLLYITLNLLARMLPSNGCR
ncbi:hypothetical protein CRUP_018711 [Coryphaenoides rupestris]|nr:hypothetical protein CRUP_018711 [Coryphaenoides rupestris]